MIKRQTVIGILMKKYRITLKEASETWEALKPLPGEHITINTPEQFLAYLQQLEADGETKLIDDKKEEEKPMEKKDDVKKLVERYGTIEDSAEKARIRRQLRKAGYYLSKNKEAPVKEKEKNNALDKILEEDDIEKHPITQQPPKLMEAVGLTQKVVKNRMGEVIPPIPEKQIVVSVYYNGELAQRDIVKYQKEIRIINESN